jgi:hypothetical protein
MGVKISKEDCQMRYLYLLFPDVLKFMGLSKSTAIMLNLSSGVRDLGSIVWLAMARSARI